MKLKHKAWLAFILVLLACLAIMAASLMTLKTAADTDNEARVKQLMTSAAMTIGSLENLAAKGVLSDEKAKEIAIEILRENKYHPAEYCFVVDDKLNFVAAPMDPQLHGTSFDDFKDAKGQSVGKLALEALSRSGGKLTTYVWSSFNPKTNVTAMITSVAVQSPRWKWVVGNGLNDAEASARFRASVQWLLPLCIATAAIVGGGLLLSVRRLVRALGGEPDLVVQRVQRVAHGDLTEEPRGLGEAPPPAGSLLFAVENMRESLQLVMRGVHEATQSMTIASHEIASGNQDLSDRTEAAAASLQQTASNMQLLSEKVSSSANSAGQAQQLAQAASAAAQKGGKVVFEVVATMDAINAGSGRISEIISVIDGIAFQTNILALNAAVEAARAGEQGRGFAVVAGEVRILAQRSAQAAREIKVLIGESVDRADSGARLVSNAGETMQDIVSSVLRVADTISDITASTAEQSAKLGEVGSEITQLDSMTQQNSALVEQSAAAAASLRSQADRLSDLLKTFSV